ncbi:phosphotransferase [Streptomyces sp. NPDC059080]|uniref:phosphotransferase n=1 Tax=Streptomyces sp. NPDC059080 TaxID=3346718 RepID=UPI00367CAAFE
MSSRYPSSDPISPSSHPVPAPPRAHGAETRRRHRAVPRNVSPTWWPTRTRAACWSKWCNANRPPRICDGSSPPHRWRPHTASPWCDTGGYCPTTPSLRESVGTELEALLPQADLTLIGDAGTLRSALRATLTRLDDTANVPALTHGDLWLPNVLVRDGRISCVLDFEHATYADRFGDFGKLDEHPPAVPAGG